MLKMFQLFFLSFSLFFNFSFFSNYQYFFYLNIQRFVENILGTLSLWLAGLWLANLTATAMSHRPPPPSLPPSPSKSSKKRTDWKKWNGGCSADVSSIKELIRSFNGKTRPAPYRRDAALRSIRRWRCEAKLENTFELDSLRGGFIYLSFWYAFFKRWT